MKLHATRTLRTIAFAGTALALATGCNKKADNTVNYTSAINSYYSAHPACLFSQPKQFPAQVDTSDTSKTSPMDALVDQGLLVRTTAEKKVFIVASKQVTNYDLSSNGRSAWTADTSQPGFGNFCYGHRKVSSIDTATPTNSNPGATTQIAYHYTMDGVPSWTQAAETKNAYPNVSADLSGPQASTATLTNTSSGWQLTSAPGDHNATTAADGKVVQ